MQGVPKRKSDAEWVEQVRKSVCWQRRWGGRVFLGLGVALLCAAIVFTFQFHEIAGRFGGRADFAYLLGINLGAFFAAGIGMCRLGLMCMRGGDRSSWLLVQYDEALAEALGEPELANRVDFLKQEHPSECVAESSGSAQFVPAPLDQWTIKDHNEHR